MLLIKEELYCLTTKDGGKFSVSSLNEAYLFCKKLSRHYENFPVGSLLIPNKYRNHFFSVYSFARLADDIADELMNEEMTTRIEALKGMDNLITDTELIAAKKGNPVFVALHESMKKLDIPALPFQKLLVAFQRDICFSQPNSFDELIDYCNYSANPIGELVTRIFGLYNKTTANYSDKICTALQLVNFWQDISIDKEKKRVYIPKELLTKYEINEENLFKLENSVNLNNCLNELFDITEKLFIEGRGILDYLKPYRLKLEINVTIEGGMAILKKARKLGTKLLFIRPKLTFIDKIKILINSL